MKLKNLTVRNYIGEVDKARVEDLERRCGVGPADHAFFTDTMGDPICRIRNSPMYNMLVRATPHHFTFFFLFFFLISNFYVFLLR